MSTTSTASLPTGAGNGLPAVADLSSTFGVQSARVRDETPSGGMFPPSSAGGPSTPNVGNLNPAVAHLFSTFGNMFLPGSTGGPSTTVADSTYDNGQWTQT